MKQTIVASMLLISIFEFYDMVETQYQLPQHLLYYVASQETNQGTNTGSTVVEKVIPYKHQKYLRAISKHVGVPTELFVGSHSGAIGRMQFLVATWIIFKQDGNGDGVRDPRDDFDSVATAGYYLAWLIGRTGSVHTALVRYSGSEKYAGQVLACLRRSQSCPHDRELAQITR